MDDQEFYERAYILLDDFTGQIADLVLQDYENLNLVFVELDKRMRAAGARPRKELGKRYTAEQTNKKEDE
jgi:dihydroneopterin aldolase